MAGRPSRVLTALAHYGTWQSYANDVVNCVIELELGNFNGAKVAAHGKW